MTHKTGRMQQITKTKNNQTITKTQKNNTENRHVDEHDPPPPIKKGKEKLKKRDELRCSRLSSDSRISDRIDDRCPDGETFVSIY